MDKTGEQNKTTTLAVFFGKLSSLKYRLGKLLDKLSEVLLESYYIYTFNKYDLKIFIPNVGENAFFWWFSSTLTLNCKKSIPKNENSKLIFRIHQLLYWKDYE